MRRSGRAVFLVLAFLTLAGAVAAQPGGLTPEALKNGRYFSSLFEGERWFHLTNGVYATRYGADFLEVRLTQMAFGDLNGDGRGDAAVILISNTGGSGSFVELAAVLNDQGQPRHAASADLGDRVKVNRLAIDRGVIVLDLVTHGPEDPSCCPTWRTTFRYRLQGGRLVKQ